MSQDTSFNRVSGIYSNSSYLHIKGTLVFNSFFTILMIEITWKASRTLVSKGVVMLQMIPEARKTLFIHDFLMEM